MDFLQFFSSVVSSIAWPAAVIILVLILRKPISKVIPNLKKLKYKEVEIDFGSELNKLEEKAKSIDAPPKPLAQPMEAQKDSNQTLRNAENLSESIPQAAVSVAWSAVESEIMSAVMRLAISPDYPPYNSALKNARLLAEQNAIDAITLELLEGMRKLRNVAVHGHATDEPITTRQAREFVFLSKGVVDRLKSLTRH